MSTLCSAALQDELLRELRRSGVLVWLDKDGDYTPFVDALCQRHRDGAFPIPVVPYRQSFLEVVLALEDHGGGLDNAPLLIHLPGYNEDSVRQTPLLELYRAGTRYRKSLLTLVEETASGRVAPDDIQRFLAAPGLTLAKADAWLDQHSRQQTGGLDAVLAPMSASVLCAELLARNTFLAAHLHDAADLRVLQQHLHRHTGIDDAWLAFYAPGAPDLAALASALGAWLLCVEYVHDLSRPPHLPALQPLRALPEILVKACVALVDQLRRQHPDRYAHIADEAEAGLRDEFAAVRAEDLGRVDTFRCEEVSVLRAALAALQDGDWPKAQRWVKDREGETSFWLQHEQLRRFEWTLVAEATALGLALAQHPRPLHGARDLDEAVARYAESAHRVDRCHRRLEQQRLRLLEPRLPHYGELHAALAALRARYHAWADELCRDFSALCRAHGFLPEDALQQRTLYEQVVHPLLDGADKVALFVVDALRYELAAELLEDLKAPGARVELRPRLAELPTTTAIGMNALAPVARGGRMTLLASGGDLVGFQAGEYGVRRPEDRARAMGQRSIGKPALLLDLRQVCDGDPALLKRQIAQARLIIVHSRELDDAGELRLGLATFELTLRHLKAAWNHLQAAGVKQAVFTADHGFLLLDGAAAPRRYGSKRDPWRRHVWEEQLRDEPGLVAVSLPALGYDGASGALLFREDAGVFATGASGDFAHGGNSPQERVIPVLTIGRQREAGAALSAYRLEAQGEPDVLGLRRLRLRVQLAPQQTGSLGFVAAATIAVALRVPGREDITVTLKDVPGVGLRGGQVALPVRDEWTEVFFALSGERDERARVEVFHPDAVERVEPCVLAAWFQVEGGGPAVGSARAAAPDWREGLADEGARRVFVHIDQHGSISEEEVVRLLGSPRAARRFALEFEGHTSKLPFRVRIETAASGKRYRKEGDV